MTWNSLGTVILSENWATFPVDCVGSEVFRVVSTSDIRQGDIAYLARYFPAPTPGGRLSPYRKLYANQPDLLLELKIPEALKDAGIYTFTFQIRRKLPFIALPWSVEILAFS